MIIFRDALSDANEKDELLTDTYRYKLENEIIYKVTGKLTTETSDISDAAIGGNASEDGAGCDEGGDASSVSGIDVCLANRLCEFPMTKGLYKKHIKDYMGRVKKHLEDNGTAKEEIATFLKNAQTFVVQVIKEFDEYQFFVGETMNEKGMCVLVRWDEETPYLYYFKHGLLEEKV
jgi:hypothetical protein